MASDNVKFSAVVVDGTYSAYVTLTLKRNYADYLVINVFPAFALNALALIGLFIKTFDMDQRMDRVRLEEETRHCR